MNQVTSGPLFTPAGEMVIRIIFFTVAAVIIAIIVWGLRRKRDKPDNGPTDRLSS